MLNVLLPIGSVVETNTGRKYIVIGYNPNYINGVNNSVHRFIPYPCDCSKNIKYNDYKDLLSQKYNYVLNEDMSKIVISKIIFYGYNSEEYQELVKQIRK